MAIITISIVITLSLLFVSLALIELLPQIKSIKETEERIKLAAIETLNIEEQCVAYLQRQAYLKSLIK